MHSSSSYIQYMRLVLVHHLIAGGSSYYFLYLRHIKIGRGGTRWGKERRSVVAWNANCIAFTVSSELPNQSASPLWALTTISNITRAANQLQCSHTLYLCKAFKSPWQLEITGEGHICSSICWTRCPLKPVCLTQRMLFEKLKLQI